MVLGVIAEPLLFALFLAPVQCPPGPSPPPPPPAPVSPGPAGPSAPTSPGATAPAPSAPSTPSPGAPSTPSPKGPTSPPPNAAPSTPASAPSAPGGGPRTGGGGAPIAPSGPATPSGPSIGGPSSGGGAPPGPDISSWELWWTHNSAPYLELDALFFRDLAITADADFGEAAGDALDAVNLPVSEKTIREQIVPALLATLASDPNDEVTNACLLALARIGENVESELGDSMFADVFAQHLDHPVQGVCENAAAALGVLAHPRSVAILASLLHDQEEGRELTGRNQVPRRMRAFAAYGLGLTGQYSKNDDVRRFATRHLLDGLAAEDASNDERVACVIALGLVSPDRTFASADSEMPSMSTEALVRHLLVLFEDGDTDDLVRAHLPTSIANHLPRVSDELRGDVVDALVGAVAKSSRETNAVQQSCAMALGRIGDADEDRHDKEIRKALERVVDGGDQLARHYALISLARIAGHTGDGKGDPVAGTGEVRDFLFKQLERGKSSARPWVGLAIGVMGRALDLERRPLSMDELATLRTVLDDQRSPSTAAALSLGAGLCGDTSSVEALIAKLDDISDPVVQGKIALALGMVGAEKAKPAIYGVMEENFHHMDVMRDLTLALAMMGDRDLVPKLIGFTSECDCIWSDSALAQAMGHTGDARAVDPLLGMLTREDAGDRTKAYAALGLGMLADKDTRAWTSRISTNVNYGANPDTLTSADGVGIIDFK